MSDTTNPTQTKEPANGTAKASGRSARGERLRETLRNVFSQRSARVGVIILGFLVFTAVFADIIAPYVKNGEHPLGWCEHPAYLRQDDRQIGAAQFAWRDDDADVVLFHQQACLATAKVWIDDVEIGDLNSLTALGDLDRQVDGHLGFTGAVVAHDHDQLILRLQ